MSMLNKIPFTTVNIEGINLRYVKEQTDEICMAAVKKDGHALQYVIKKKPEICLAAINQNPWALEYLDPQTPNILEPMNQAHQSFRELGWRNGDYQRICLLAVKNSGITIRFARLQTPELCLNAVNESGWALKHINKNTPNKIDLSNPDHQYFYDLGWRDGDFLKICEKAVKKHGGALQFIEEQTEAMCIDAVQAGGINFHFRYVKTLTPAICLAAINHDVRYIIGVHDLTLVADSLNRKNIKAAFNSGDRDVISQIKKVIKIREANAISYRINKALSQGEFNLQKRDHTIDHTVDQTVDQTGVEVKPKLSRVKL